MDVGVTEVWVQRNFRTGMRHRKARTETRYAMTLRTMRMRSKPDLAPDNAVGAMTTTEARMLALGSRGMTRYEVNLCDSLEQYGYA